MKTEIEYTNEPMGKLRAVKDFLPPPEELVFEEDTVKVTIALRRPLRGSVGLTSSV